MPTDLPPSLTEVHKCQVLSQKFQNDAFAQSLLLGRPTHPESPNFWAGACNEIGHHYISLERGNITLEQYNERVDQDTFACLRMLRAFEEDGLIHRTQVPAQVGQIVLYSENAKTFAAYMKLPRAPYGHMWVLNPLYGKEEAPDCQRKQRYILYDLNYQASGICAPRAEPSCSYTNIR